MRPSTTFSKPHAAKFVFASNKIYLASNGWLWNNRAFQPFLCRNVSELETNQYVINHMIDFDPQNKHKQRIVNSGFVPSY